MGERGRENREGEEGGGRGGKTINKLSSKEPLKKLLTMVFIIQPHK